MAHLDHPTLRILREMVIGVLEFSTYHSDVCKRCALGKYVNTNFPRNENRASRTVDLVHSDRCGPMSTTSLKGYKYYVTFIDDFSRKTWIYFVKSKQSKEVL